MAKSSKKNHKKNKFHKLKASIRSLPKDAKRIGPANPDEILSVTILLRRKPGSGSLPNQEYWGELSPEKREYLSRKELGEKYGASLKDVNQVLKFAKKK